jgi:CheY-like chemotaxis protein
MDGCNCQRVLIVDDDPALIALLSDGLQLVGGYDVAVAADGASGLDSCTTTLPACVIVDVRMPGLNGYQFVRALRGDPATADVAIIVLSALAQEREQLAGLLAGADAYLSKPVKMADLLATVSDAVSLTPPQRTERRRTLLGDPRAK